MASDTSTPAGNSIRKVAIASFVGSAIEWYDFFLYGTARRITLYF